MCTARRKQGTQRTRNTAQGSGHRVQGLRFRVQGPASKNRELNALGVITTVAHERKEKGWYIYIYICIYIYI